VKKNSVFDNFPSVIEFGREISDDQSFSDTAVGLSYARRVRRLCMALIAC
jgi:hypothetical protein